MNFESYPTDIARNTGIDATNVIGGLQGMGNGFAKSNSLIERGIVEKIEHEDATYYRLTERGKLLIEIESLNKVGRATVAMGKDFAKVYKKIFAY